MLDYAYAKRKAPVRQVVGRAEKCSSDVQQLYQGIETRPDQVTK
jgi:hypothetical protein